MFTLPLGHPAGTSVSGGAKSEAGASATSASDEAPKKTAKRRAPKATTVKAEPETITAEPVEDDTKE